MKYGNHGSQAGDNTTGQVGKKKGVGVDMIGAQHKGRQSNWRPSMSAHEGGKHACPKDMFKNYKSK